MLFKLLARLWKFLHIGLRPPPGTPSRQVRLGGAVMTAFGLSMLAATSVLGVLIGRYLGAGKSPNLQRLITALTPLWFLGYAAMILGLFRLVLGRDPEHYHPLVRVVLGVVLTFGSLVLLFVLIVIGWYLTSQAFK